MLNSEIPAPPKTQSLQPEVQVLPRKVAEQGAKQNLIGQSKDALKAHLQETDLPERHLNMRTNQIWTWIYQKGARDFETMHTLPKILRAHLTENFTLERPEIVTRQISTDGTRKYLLRIDGGHEVECVYIPEKTRGTLCLSSQVGCTLTCPFCHTGTQRLVRNLTAGEIISQVLVARDDLQEWDQPARDKRMISNLVLMGMGEPLYNTDAVRDAMLIAMEGSGIALSRRRITLSTSGIVPEIARVGREIGCLLAISLHACSDTLRDKLVPINKKYPVAELIAACHDYPRVSNSERITFEYVMLRGVNDSDADARDLVRLIAGIPAKLNLIPFNSWPGAPFECSTAERMESFAGIVNDAGYASPVRRPRGQDILAACGQLKSASERHRKATVKSAVKSAVKPSVKESVHETA